jgi:hypothetical protein
MRKTMWLVVGAILLAPATVRAVDSDDINKAIDRGVAYLRSQQHDGSFGAGGGEGAMQPGPTALVGLALLECDVAPDDPVITRAAAFVRKGSLSITDTYGIALCVLFLDRLGDPPDVPLIESLTVRLLAGQLADGSWTYKCPNISADEVRRLQTLIDKRSELSTRRDLKPGTRTFADVSEPIKAQLKTLTPGTAALGGDHSNTQFANIALWVARRYALPVDTALGRIELHYRKCQHRTGGWFYSAIMQQPTPTMTCAGILGLMTAYAVNYGDKPKAKPVALDADPALVAGLAALGTTVGEPVGNHKDPKIPKVGGRTFYFLWSLERICVGLDMKVLAKRDWYQWGAEILLANQIADGSWRGEFARQEADTCFALLFLKRANLVRDLTAGLKGKMGKLGERTLSTGPEKFPKKLGIEPKDSTTPDPVVKPPVDKPPPDAREEQASARLANELVKASADDQAAGVLARLREGRGAEYTEALTTAIARLGGERKARAREALSQRLTRMKPDTLKRYLTDEEPEIRRAAAAACATRELKVLIPSLIPLLKDRTADVAQAAHAALKGLSGETLDADAAAWEAWWSKQPKE